jgi:hypothetical protein
MGLTTAASVVKWTPALGDHLILQPENCTDGQQYHGDSYHFKRKMAGQLQMCDKEG